MGRRPSFASAKSAAVHLSSPTWGGGGLGGFSPGLAGPPGGLTQILPSVRGFGPPGRRLSSGSTTNGRCSNSISMASMASAAVSSSTAATARIGSPWYSGSMVSAFSPCLLALITAPRSVTLSAGAGRSSCVRIALTPGMASALLKSRCFTRPCGTGLKSSLQNSMPSARKSSAYFALPVTFA